MTWSGSIGSDARLSLDEFTDARRETHAAAPEMGFADPVSVQIPVDVATADKELDVADAPAKAAEMPYPVPLPPVAKPVVYRSHDEICEMLTEAAQSNNLPIPFFISLLFQESRFDPSIISNSGAQGIAQFMPETAADMGVKNPFDPLQAIPASARLLRNLISQFGNLGLAAAAYNAGPRRIQDWLGKKGKLPEETQGYVKSVTGRPAENWTAASAEHPGQRLPRYAPCQEAAGLYAWTGPETIPLPAPAPHRMMAAATAPQDIKVASQQLAARKHKPEKPKLEKVAQR